MTEADAGGSEPTAVTPAPAVAAEKSLWHYLGLVLSAAVLLLVIALAVMLIVVPKATGSIPLTVLTSSMEPGFPPGTLIIVRPVDPSDLRLGDVITYQMQSGKPGVITHRIMAINSSSAGDLTFVLQGDNNSEPDLEEVLAEQIQGRLWYSVPFIGFVNSAVNGENRAWIIPVGAVLLFSYAGYMVASGALAAVKKRRGAQP
ncbi:signal peptidase I [Cryobacterium roopkundense]|uniref:Signal peptidase I n=1 Tax=Cryobacterium roopkundense TaxID=1001240 RepID=A0A7W8ZYR6_9MICO|nr:signal peptidase I [Cryobacterium roopkundense]MBB5642693.1 signal peptidase [Cryobacterium roopkundense]